jgi:hypothetical protein
MGHGGCWGEGGKISDIVNESVGRSNSDFNVINEVDRAARGVNVEMVVGRKNNNLKGKCKEVEDETKGWVVPEKNRFQLTAVDFHTRDRYIKVKCQKVVRGENGTREERETVIAW